MWSLWRDRGDPHFETLTIGITTSDLDPWLGADARN
jgi:hypothetical protein